MDGKQWNAGLARCNANPGHDERHSADQAIVVAPGFPSAAIEDADRHGIVLLATEIDTEVLVPYERGTLPMANDLGGSARAWGP